MSCVANAQTISSIAGDGNAGYGGDGGIAVTSQLNNPWGLAMDRYGRLFIADRGNNRIRKVDHSGIITTVAGNGMAGYTGDGGAATSASLNSPSGLAIDSSGNLYIADKDNHCIRKVSTSGMITTIAGNGHTGYTGDGGHATSAQFNNPRGIAVDATGNIYVADAGNHVIRKIDKSGIIATIAGNGSAGYSGDGGPAIAAQLYGPYHIAVDNVNNVFIADVDNARIRKVATSGIITTVAGNGIQGYSGDGGPATDASLREPISIAIDYADNLYIADAWNARIRRVNTAGIIETVAGTGIPGYEGDGGPAISAQLNNPYGLTLSGTTLFIADNGNSRIRLMNTIRGFNASQPVHTTILVYPNPSNGEFYVRVNSKHALSQHELIGIDGRKYLSFTCISNWPLLLRTSIPRGIYFIICLSDPETSPAALLIQ